LNKSEQWQDLKDASHYLSEVNISRDGIKKIQEELDKPMLDGF